MGIHYALIVAVEDYLDKSIPSVTFAEADALAVSDALVKHGFEKADQTLLLNSRATKAVIESKIGQLVRKINEEDRLYIFYAGHGLAVNCENYITCSDTVPTAAEFVKTSISLQWLFRELSSTKCKQILVFLDSCHSGLPYPTHTRSMYGNIKIDELRDFLTEAEYCLCFTSCKSDELSHSHPDLGHGIWTYHLLEVLEGHANGANAKGTIVTGASLQNYLKKQVKLTLRAKRADGAVQTPWMVGGLSQDFMVADIAPLLAEYARAPVIGSIKQWLFESISIQRITTLSGFQKARHFVPKYYSPSVSTFIAEVSESDITEDLDRIRHSLREGGLKRADIKVTQENSSATLITPDFEYQVSVEIDRDDLKQVIWARYLKNISNPSILSGDYFNSAFSNTFDVITLQVDTEINVAQIIDVLEDRVLADGVEVHYPHSAEFCNVNLRTPQCMITISSHSVEFKFQQELRPKELLETALAAQKYLSQHYGSDLVLGPSKTRQKLPGK